MSGSSQRLISSNTSPDIADALGAPVKDPLWQLARQWQFGEFEAETGGLPVQVHITMRELAVDSVVMGGKRTRLNPAIPLEAMVEAENTNGTAPAWHPQTLAYAFSLSVGGTQLQASDYDGRALDWHDFVLPKGAQLSWTKAKKISFAAIPGQLQFPGAPLTRWWTIEPGEAYFDSAVDPEPNILSMMLPEFFYTDIRNWYLVPAPAHAGTIRRIDKVEVVDSFGVVTEIEPTKSLADADPFNLFALSAGDGSLADPATLFTPNIAGYVLDCDLCEETGFHRDEGANLVWAHERVVQDEDGVPHATRLDQTPDTLDADQPGSFFTLKSDTARAFIPYVPRQTAETPAVNGDIALRRGRTQADRSEKDPQYRGQIVGEAKWVSHETVPPTGIRVRRIHRFARGTDGEPHFWVGRDRDISARTSRPGLRFDYLRTETGEDS